MRARPPKLNTSTLALAGLIASMASAPAFAASCTWNTTAGNWAAFANWAACVAGNGNPAGVPGSSDTATIGATGVVSINSGQSVLNLNNAGQINIDAFGLNLVGGGGTSNTGVINVGGASTANIGISSGHTLNNAGGVIHIGSGSVVNQFGAAISGGTINTTGTGTLAVQGFTAANTLSNVTLAGNMDMNGGQSQRVLGGLVLGGTASVGSGSYLAFEGTQTLSGSGSIVLDNNAGNRINVDGNGSVLTIGNAMTIRGGSGRIGEQYWVAGGGQSIVNNGTVSAEVAGGTLVLAGGTFTNNGTVSAVNGGTMRLDANYVGNAGSQLLAGAGSRVEQNAVTLSGVVNVSGDFRPLGFSAGNIVDGVTFNGNMNMAAGANVSQRVINGLTLNGSVNVGNGSYLSFQGSQTLAGNGSVVFADSSANNRLNVDGGGAVLTVGANSVIRGHTGTIGEQYWVAGGGQGIVNNGRISADVNGGLITITGGLITNNSTVEAQNGGTLRLNSNYQGNAGSTLTAGVGSRIEQNGVTLSGVVNVSGDLRPLGFSAGNFLDGVTLNGDMNMAPGANVSQRVVNGLALNGSINVGNGSYLTFQGSQTLAGSGSVVFADSSAGNRLNVDGNGSVLTIGTSSVIRGHTGTIGEQYWVAGGGQRIVNDGRIAADVGGGLITITGGSITNNSIVEAQNGGRLRLNSNYVGISGSQLLAGSGSSIEQNGVVLSGVVNVSGDFRPLGFSASNFLDGVTLNGNMNMASGVNVSQRVINGLALNGSIHVGNGSYLAFQGSQTLSGSGSIVLDSSTSNRVNVDGNGSVLTIGATSVIRGHSGTIGEQYWLGGGGQSIVNNGRIAADVAGGMVIISGAPITNNGVVEAQNGGTLRLSSNYTGSTGAGLNAGAGSRIEQNGVTLSGVLNVTGDFRPLGFSAGNVLDGVTLNGNMNMATGANVSQRVTGGLALNGTINVGDGSYLSFQGNQTLSGNGNIVLDSSTNNRINVDGNGGRLTIGSGVTLSGHSGRIGDQYWVGGGGQSIVNNGTINASAAGGNLIVTVPLTGTGTLQVAGGTLTQSGVGASTQGRLVVGAAGSFNTSNQNLTINSDYTNVQASTGNSFDRRAGIAGTGQILAGGNAAQVITGSAVTGGATTNATLTVGNVRVGANTFNVQIGNAGSTGPTLRGAIQTNVNGGNISDARLTGTAVTAGNYNAGAPGGNSGNLGVTFTAASAGAMAPLTGQAINLRSNFDNIADQRLNIVLAGGAAAYNAAVGSAAPTPVMVANQRVGGSNSAALTVSNTAAAGAFSEDLRASFGSSTGAATNNSGSVNALVAGASNAGAMSVGVNTSTAGARSGSVTLNYQTTGTVNGVSNGLGLSGANPAQVINVSGNVYQAASGALQTAPLNFGTVQVGQTINQNLVVRNTASGAAGFVEDLYASFGASGNSQITGSGALNGITAGTNSSGANGTMTVTVQATTAGALNSSIGVNYFSAGAVGGVSNGLGTLAVGSDNHGVSGTIQATGNVINQANAQLNNPSINLGAVRVGAAAPSGTVSVTNLAGAPPQAALNAAFASTSGAATASGSFNGLAPGATNNGSLLVGLNTTTAGNFTGGNAGTATISFVSDASNVGNCAPNCQLNLASQTVNVEGKVYTQAVGSAGGTAINFGVVRVGDTVSAANITISNTAASTALNDALRADVAGIGGAFSAPASVAGIAAQAAGQMAVALNTGTAGIFSQTGSIGFTSQNADMADVSAGANATVSLMAQVNNLANGDFDLQSGTGTLSQTGTSYVLDLGTIVLGNTVSSTLQLDNDVAGPADALSGAFDLTAADDFGYSGWNPLAFLAAGQAGGSMGVNWMAGALGLFSDTILFNGFGTNASDPLGLAQTRQLIIRANVINGVPPGTVPEPGTLALLLGAAAAAMLARRKAGVKEHEQGAAR